jgi:beta-N-acetylhexosaminidase
MNVRKYLFIFIFLITMLLLGGCSLLKNENNMDNVVPSTPVTDTNKPELSSSSTSVPTTAPTSTPTKTPTTETSITPTTETTNGSRAQAMLQKMTLEEKVGQLFFVRLRKEQALEDIKNYYLGGYIFFGDDFKDENKTSIKNLIVNYQSASAIPMLIGVDEEGGTVNRISKYPAFRAVPFYSPIDLYKEGGFDLIRSDTLEKANLLLDLGINVNLAPVCDVSTNPNDFIYSRSFGKDAEDTSAYVKAVVEVMKQNKLGSTLKHFPGYGNNVDTHTGIAIDKRSYNTFATVDFLPFEAGIKAGADSILVSHNIVTSLDKDYPASLSPKIHEILRNDLGFTGVIMTDDLSMDAIKEYTEDDAAAVQAILAGNDLLIASNFEQQIPAVLAAVKDGTISESRIDESVLRVLKWKLALDIVK